MKKDSYKKKLIGVKDEDNVKRGEIVIERWIKQYSSPHKIKPIEEDEDEDEEEEEEQYEYKYEYKHKYKYNYDYEYEYEYEYHYDYEYEYDEDEDEEEEQYEDEEEEEEQYEYEEEEEEQYKYIEDEEKEEQYQYIEDKDKDKDKDKDEEEEEQYDYIEYIEDEDEEEQYEYEEIWMNEYSSLHKILLVGEGDFSFSACLAKAFGSATNMIATSLNSKGYLRENYKRAIANINKLTSRGCRVEHGVNATQMATNPLFEGMKFDRIVFNFPHAGCFQETRKLQLKLHRKLMDQFMENAKKMISEEGEIHVRHKCTALFHSWNLELLGSRNGLWLIEEEDFNLWEFPGYHTKYGFSGDKDFNCDPSKTYIFGLL